MRVHEIQKGDWHTLGDHPVTHLSTLGENFHLKQNTTHMFCCLVHLRLDRFNLQAYNREYFKSDIDISVRFHVHETTCHVLDLCLNVQTDFHNGHPHQSAEELHTTRTPGWSTGFCFHRRDQCGISVRNAHWNVTKCNKCRTILKLCTNKPSHCLELLPRHNWIHPRIDVVILLQSGKCCRCDEQFARSSKISSRDTAPGLTNAKSKRNIYIYVYIRLEILYGA